MISWLKIKLAMAKSWSWIKEYWQVPFLIVWTAAVWLLTRRNTQALVDTMETRNASYKKQIEVLRKTHNDEVMERKKLTEEYEILLEKLEKEFSEKNKVLSEKQKNDLKDVIIKSKGEPDAIRKRIEEEFGFTFVE